MVFLLIAIHTSSQLFIMMVVAKRLTAVVVVVVRGLGFISFQVLLTCSVTRLYDCNISLTLSLQYVLCQSLLSFLTPGFNIVVLTRCLKNMKYLIVMLT